MSEEEFNFRDYVRKLVDDDSTDWEDAVLVLPRGRSVTYNSASPLTAVGIIEWCKEGLLVEQDDSEDGELNWKGFTVSSQGVH